MSATKKTKRAKAAPPVEQQLPEVVEAFKGFDANLTCRDFRISDVGEFVEVSP